jgi:metal-responsive CopG/Arc/MetJ family transcriptional regulator
MANVKTAISLQESIFEQVETMAKEMGVSRSRLFTLALEEYFRRHQNRNLLEKINRAYQDSPHPDEKKRLRKMRSHHRKLVEGSW